MDVVGSEIGQKMRSAIKAKLTELGCYVDDELPDYVMVMVANKRTRSQMEDDLQLFLGDNTELFVNWLHQVLKKLQEVTVAAPIKTTESEVVAKERSTSKERKSKEKKEKSKKSDSSKKSKKKAKEKVHKKKDEKKKSKKKSKHEMIRPNIPPLLMNIEKESEPSITDVFAGQILKNHGIILETHKNEPKIEEQKPIIETKRPIIPIIDPASIPSQTSDDLTELNTPDTIETVTSAADNVEALAREDKIKEVNKIELKIEGLKQKLADQLDSTDDEDFLNIRTEADELINDFPEDGFKETPQPLPTVTPPLRTRESRSPSLSPSLSPLSQRKEAPKNIPEPLPHIELNLPKRPIRERLGAPTQKREAIEYKEKSGKTTELAEKSPERFTPEKEPVRPQLKSAKSRLGSQQVNTEPRRKKSTSDDSEKSENNSRRLTSRVSVLERRAPRVTCASVVRVRPRPRVSAPASSLLLRAVADAHKSLLSIPPKVDPEPQKVKRALVLPMRRCVDPKKIVIQVPCNDTPNSTPADSISDNISLGEDLDSEIEDKSPKTASTDKEEYTPIAITKVIQNTEYVPSRTLIRRDDTVYVETINIHNTTVDKDKKTQFIVTMDGYHPNAFLAKKLMTEGLLNDDDEVVNKTKETDKIEKSKNENPPQTVVINVDNDGTKVGKVSEEKTTVPPILSQIQTSDEKNENRKEHAKEDGKKRILEKRKSEASIDKPVLEKRKSDGSIDKPVLEKRKSDGSIDKPVLEKRKSDGSIDKPVLEKRKSDVSLEKPEKRKDDLPIDKPVVNKPVLEKRKSDASLETPTSQNDQKNSPPVKKRKASPIIFDVHKKEKEVDRVRERTLSASSDSHVVLTTASNTHKYDTLPPLSQASKVMWCRAFPLCRYGASCAFAHPRCKFAAACTRRACPYSHALAPAAAPGAPSLPVVASHVVPAANYKSISAAAFTNICKFYPSCSNPACHYYHPKPCRYGKACANKLECNFYHHDVPGGKWKYSV